MYENLVMPSDVKGSECHILTSHSELNIEAGKEALAFLLQSPYIEEHYERIPSNVVKKACELCELRKAWESIKTMVKENLRVS